MYKLITNFTVIQLIQSETIIVNKIKNKKFHNII